MELRQLRSFVHVAELGSISVAAERLHIVQSALTRQIQSLEADVGTRLFNRHKRGVSLTPQGEAFLSRALVILKEVEAARSECKSESGSLTGEVSFGIPPTVAEVVAGELIERFHRMHPQVKLKAVSSYSGYVLDWLQQGIIDVGIIYEVKKRPTIKAIPLIVESLFFVEPAGTPSRSPAVTLLEATSQNLVLPSRHHGLRLLIDAVAARQGIEIVPVVEADSLSVQIDLVQRGLGCTILPLVSVSEGISAGRLRARPITQPAITRRLVLATPIDRPMTTAVRAFTEMVEGSIKAFIQSGRWRGALNDGSN